MTNPEDDPWFWGTRPREKRQSQSRAVHDAERLAREFGPEVDAVEKDQVAQFLSHALAVSKIERPAPEFAIDLSDEKVLIDLLEPDASATLQDDWQLHGLVKDGVIHIHPKHLNKWTLLHELAHFLAPMASHGPIWCRIYVDLVANEFGSELAEILESLMREGGAEVANRLE